MLELQCIGFLWAKSVSVFKNNDWQQIAKALMFEDPALEMFLPAIATCVLVHITPVYICYSNPHNASRYEDESTLASTCTCLHVDYFFEQDIIT